MHEFDNLKFPRSTGNQKRPTAVQSVRQPVSGDHRPAPKQRRKREKKLRINLKDMTFRPEEERKKPLPSSKKKEAPSPQDMTLSPYYRFSLKSQPISSQIEPDVRLDWDLVGKVSKIVNHPDQCPICQEDEMTAGVVNRCGHSFCRPCVYRYFLKNERKILLCPVCTEKLYLKSLLPVHFIHVDYIQEGGLIQMSLLTRSKNSCFLEKYGISLNSCKSVIYDSEDNFVYNRLSLQRDPVQDLTEQLEALSGALTTTSDSFEIEALKMAINQVHSSQAKLIQNPGFYNAEAEEPSYFIYQSADGQPYFLHPVNIKMLLWQYGDFEHCPIDLAGKVLEIEELRITDKTYQKMKFLNFLSKGTVVNLVELDLTGVISEDTLVNFSEEVRNI